MVLLERAILPHVCMCVCVCLQEDAEVWQIRPCPFPVLRLMAVSVVHLHALRKVLLDNLMMDYMNLVDSYLNNSFYKPGELQQVDTVT